MTEAVSPIHGRRLDARFTLLEKLGSGGQGEVWRAHDDTRGIDIALKVPASATAPNDSVLAAFEREHAIAARLEHSSVLKVFPPHRSGEVVVLPMELATGGDLRRLRGAGYLDIIPVLLDIAQALEHAHERGVIHRDLKPGNVLFDARGRVKLADFGAAGTMSTTAAEARAQGLSPFTASPEQLRGEAPTETDDIYGLGALAYELLSGYPPYYPHFDLRKAQSEPVPKLVPTRQIPPLLSALVTRMLAKDRRERPRSMREVIDELDAALNDTLAFDFESIVDPTHGAPSASVLVGPAAGPRTGAAASATPTATASAKAEPRSPAAVAQKPPLATPPTPTSAKAEAGYTARDQDDLDEDLDQDESEVEDEEEEGPDLGLIPDLLVANALVVTPAPKGNKASATQTPTRAAVPAASKASREQHNDTMHLPPQPASTTRGGPTARGSDAQMLHNDTMHLPPQPASTTRGGPAARATDAQMLHNDTMHLPPEPQSTTRGGVAAGWPSSDADMVHNDTMQLPSEPAPAIRGVGAAWRVTNAQTANNDTMQLPPEPTSATRGAAAVESRGFARPHSTQTGAPVSAQSASAAPPRFVSQRPTRSDQATNRAATPVRSPEPIRGAAPRLAAGSNRRAAANQTAATSPTGANPAGANGVAATFNPAAPGRTDGPYAAAGPNSAAGFPGAAGSRVDGPYAGAGANASAGFAGAAANRVDGPYAAVGPNSAAVFSPAAALNDPGVAPARPTRDAYTPSPMLQPAPFATAGLASDGGPSFSEDRPLWENLKLDSVPRVSRLEPIPRKHWPVVLLGLLAGVAVAVFYWLPRYTNQSLPFDISAITRAAKNLAPSLASASSSNGAAGGATAGATTGAADEATSGAATGATATARSSATNSPEATFQAARDRFDQRLATLETRGAGVWGGPEFGMAKMRAAESVGAHDAGNTQMAEQRLSDASKLLDQVEGKAAQALTAQITAGQKALAAGQEEIANQAFDLAKRIDPNDKRIAEGQRHTHNLNGVLPLLADGQNAEDARNYMRAAQDYSRALSLDPGNDKARAGLARANAAFGEDNYAKAVGSGFAALGAGRLDDARDAFEKARALRPNGSEASDGLRRVSAALSAKGFSSLRQRAAGLEAQERWDEAVQAYDSALQADPSLAFAQEGKDRAAARAELGASMQALIDRPERLSSRSIRDQAKALLDTANQQSPSGPVLRSQIARLGLLMPDYEGTAQSVSATADLMEKPIRLSLVSDNATDVAIPSIGQFGTFAKRDIQLKPGRYTVIGTRDGFRDVRRDITIAPGQESQTISVSCSDPI